MLMLAILCQLEILFSYPLHAPLFVCLSVCLLVCRFVSSPSACLSSGCWLVDWITACKQNSLQFMSVFVCLLSVCLPACLLGG